MLHNWFRSAIPGVRHSHGPPNPNPNPNQATKLSPAIAYYNVHIVESTTKYCHALSALPSIMSIGSALLFVLRTSEAAKRLQDGSMSRTTHCDLNVLSRTAMKRPSKRNRCDRRTVRNWLWTSLHAGRDNLRSGPGLGMEKLVSCSGNFNTRGIHIVHGKKIRWKNMVVRRHQQTRYGASV